MLHTRHATRHGRYANLNTINDRLCPLPPLRAVKTEERPTLDPPPGHLLEPPQRRPKKERPDAPPPVPPPKPSALKILAGFGVYTGLVGSLAFLIAHYADIDLWAMFDWSSKDVPVSLSYLLPLQVINAVIMGPDYSSWYGLPSFSAPKDLGEKLNDKQSETDDLLSSPATRPLSSMSEAGPSYADSVPASSWGSIKSRKQSPNVLKDALFIAQSHFSVNNPTVGLNLTLEILTCTVSSLSTELLFRGVSISLLASWINDRLYESGCDDFISLPSCLLFLLGHSEGSLMSLDPLPIGTFEAARWAASLACVALSLSLVVRKMLVQPVRAPIILEVSGDDSNPARSGKESSSSQASPSSSPVKRNKMPTFRNTVRLANAIQGCRNVTQTLCFNFMFAATGGNLAATYTASMLNQTVFSIFQHYATQRTRRRAAELAEELEEFTVKLSHMKTRLKKKEDNLRRVKEEEERMETARLEAEEIESKSQGQYSGFFRDYFPGESSSVAEPSAGLGDAQAAADGSGSMKKTLAALDLLLPADPSPKAPEV